MKVSEMIAHLQSLQNRYGDWEMFIVGYADGYGKLRKDSIAPMNLYRVRGASEQTNVDPYDTRGPNTEDENIPAITLNNWDWRHEDPMQDFSYAVAKFEAHAASTGKGGEE